MLPRIPAYSPDVPLPSPTPGEVAVLRALCEAEFGICFASEKEASEACTVLLRLYYLFLSG